MMQVKSSFSWLAGIGPSLNFDSYAGCHQRPPVGGSFPAVNPQ
jgi:hypothetical protein